MTDEQIITCRKIYRHYDKTKNIQDLICIEEMAELQKEIIKYRRDELYFDLTAINYDVDDIREEIADVEIMIEQMKDKYSISEEDLSIIIREKLNRQLNRIQEEDYEEHTN